MKRIKAILLVVTILCAAIPYSVFAGSYIDSDTLGEESIMGDRILVDYSGNTITYVYDDYDSELITQVNKTPHYSDVDESEKYISGISYLLQAGIIENQSSNRFNPNALITLEEFASWIGAAYRVEHSLSSERQDAEEDNNGNDLDWAFENQIIDLSLQKGDLKESISWKDALEMMYKHATIENNALITGEYEMSDGVSSKDISMISDTIIQTFVSAHLLTKDDQDKILDHSPLTKAEAAHLLSSYIKYIKRPTLIIGSNVYNYIPEEKNVSNNPKWTSTESGSHPSVHKQLTIWGFSVLFNDKTSSISNLSGKYSATARGYINTGSVDPDTLENDSSTFVGHYCNSQLKNKNYTTNPTAYTRFNNHYYNSLVAYDNGGYEYAYKELGRAMHYLEDITSPPHAALITGDDHQNYEVYARNNVISVSQLTTAPNSTYTYMASTSGQTMCTSFATESEGYDYLVYLADSSTTKKNGTKTCLKKAQRIVAGLGYRYLQDTNRL